MIYQSGSATIHGFDWRIFIDKDRSSRDNPYVNIRSDYIYCFLGYNSYHNVAGIYFDTSVVWGRKHVIWAIIKAGTNFNWSREVVETCILYGNTIADPIWSSGFYLDAPGNSRGNGELCVDDGKVTKCGGYFGTDDCRIPVKCSGPAFRSIFSSSDSQYNVWGEIYKIWIQFV